MARSVADNFLYKSNKPLDARAQFDTVLSMKEFEEKYIPESFLTFCIEDGKTYRFKNSNTVDATTGKWREEKIEPSEIYEGYYTKMEPLEKYAYEAYYDDLNYPYAYKKFEDILPATGCSSVRIGNKYGRNLDWYYNEEAEFIIHTPSAGGRFATLCTCGQMSKMTDEFVKSGEYASEYVLLPFYCVDGINEKGVFINVNVVPHDPTNTGFIEPAEDKEVQICANMIPRYVLDYCATAQEAVDYIKNHMRIYLSKELLAIGYEPHFMVGDENNTFIVEFKNNAVIVLNCNADSTDNVAGRAYMTNFQLNGVVFNASGDPVLTPATSAGQAITTVNKILPHGAGLERYNLIESLAKASTPVEQIMDKLLYTNAYKAETSPYWFTEFVGSDNTTIDSPASAFSGVVSRAQARFAIRSRDPEQTEAYGTWQTTHLIVYNIQERTAKVRFQENSNSFEIKVESSDSLPKGNKTGEALIYKDNEWTLQNGYAYTCPSPENNIYSESVTFSLNSLFATPSAILSMAPGFVANAQYNLKIGGTDFGTAECVEKGAHKEITFTTDIKLYEFSDKVYLVVGPDMLDTSSNVEIMGETYVTRYVKFDEAYLYNHIVDVDNIEDIVNPSTGILYRTTKDVYDITSPNYGSFSLSDASMAGGYSIDEEGLLLEGNLSKTWDELLGDWNNFVTLFVADASGNVWRYDYDGIQYLEKRDEEPEHYLKITLNMYTPIDPNRDWVVVYDSIAKYGGGEGGVDSYSALTNKPKINGIELVGDKTSTDLEIVKNLTQAEYDQLVADDAVNPETSYYITDGQVTVETSNYEELVNRPTLEGLVLREGMTLEDFNLMSKTEINAKLSSIMAFKGSVDTFDQLPPASSCVQGDVYYVKEDSETGHMGNYAWTGEAWDEVGGAIDMSQYQKKHAEQTLNTSNQNIEGAINELYNNKLHKEPGGLGTTATTVVGAINEIIDIAQMKEDTNITVENTSGVVQTKVVDAINTLDSLIDTTDICRQTLTGTTPSTLFEEAFNEGHTIIYKAVSFNSSWLPSGVATSDYGTCIITPASSSGTAQTSRYGSIIFQPHGTGCLYTTNMAKGVVQPWVKIHQHLYAHYLGFRYDAGHKVGISTPIITPSSTGINTQTAFRYWQQFGQPIDGRERMCRVPCSVNGSGIFGGLAVAPELLFVGAAGDAAEVKVHWWSWDNTNKTFIENNYSLGTVGSPTVSTYNEVTVTLY